MRRLLATTAITVLVTFGLSQSAQAGVVFILIVGNEIVQQDHAGEASNTIEIDTGTDPGLQENVIRGNGPGDDEDRVHVVGVTTLIQTYH